MVIVRIKFSVSLSITREQEAEPELRDIETGSLVESRPQPTYVGFQREGGEFFD